MGYARAGSSPVTGTPEKIADVVELVNTAVQYQQILDKELDSKFSGSKPLPHWVTGSNPVVCTKNGTWVLYCMHPVET